MNSFCRKALDFIGLQSNCFFDFRLLGDDTHQAQAAQQSATRVTCTGARSAARRLPRARVCTENTGVAHQPCLNHVHVVQLSIIQGQLYSKKRSLH